MSANDRRAQLAIDRAEADQGEFFFAKIKLSDGNEYKRPVFVVGKNNDSNDDEDLIVCSCTSTQPRSDYDREVQLRYKTFVRTNKIYTMSKNDLLFKLNPGLDHGIIQDLIMYCRSAIS